jgi:hypothetical protein
MKYSEIDGWKNKAIEQVIPWCTLVASEQFFFFFFRNAEICINFIYFLMKETHGPGTQ